MALCTGDQAAGDQAEIRDVTHGAGTHSIEGKKWQENAEHIAQDIWGCSAFMLSKWDSYCRVDLGSLGQNFFRAPPARSARKPMEHSYQYRLRFGTRSGCQNFRASFQGFSKTSKRRTEAYRMHVGTDFLKLPPVTGQYWSLFQCSMLGAGGTCDERGIMVVEVLKEPRARCHG